MGSTETGYDGGGGLPTRLWGAGGVGQGKRWCNVVDGGAVALHPWGRVDPTRGCACEAVCMGVVDNAVMKALELQGEAGSGKQRRIHCGCPVVDLSSSRE